MHHIVPFTNPYTYFILYSFSTEWFMTKGHHLYIVLCTATIITTQSFWRAAKPHKQNNCTNCPEREGLHEVSEVSEICFEADSNLSSVVHDS